VDRYGVLKDPGLLDEQKNHLHGQASRVQALETWRDRLAPIAALQLPGFYLSPPQNRGTPDEVALQLAPEECLEFCGSLLLQRTLEA
jgi:hypothetical protein